MPLFTYKAVREDGSTVSEDVMGTTAADVRLTLEAKGYLVLEIKKHATGLRGGVSQKDFLIFNQEFMTLVKAGLPILQALEILHRRMEKPVFKSALAGIIEAVKGGSALSDAMAANPLVFPPLFTSTVRAGEQSGALVDVLKRFIEYQKRMLAVRRKLVTALAYPVFLVLALVAVLTLFFLYIIPNFTQMYSEQAGSLPLLTTLLIGFTRVVSREAPFILLALAGAGVGVYLWQKTASGKRVVDAVKLRVPVVRTVLIQYLLSSLTRTLATVLRGGIPLVQALDTTAGVIGNSVLSRRLADTRRLVTEGVSLADAFERTKLAPDMTVRMIEVGESSGDLPQMLEDVSDFYEQEVESRLTMLTTMIEPVLMLTMGIVIAFIVVALYLPIFEMGARLK
jgi:type IV pilus assembly protein PilC